MASFTTAATSATSSAAASSTVIVPDHYTNYVNVHMSTNKLDGTNYDTWASDIRLWLKSQGYVDHLTTSIVNVPEDEVSRWSKIDAQLCMVLKSTIHLSLKQTFRSYETCSEFWEHAKLLYMNDTQRLYGICQNLLMLLLRDFLMVYCLSILVKSMFFFMILMNCCLLHPLRLKR